MSFERTGLALQNPDIQRAVTKALSVVPRDEGLIAMPRASRQAVTSDRIDMINKTGNESIVVARLAREVQESAL